MWYWSVVGLYSTTFDARVVPGGADVGESSSSPRKRYVLLLNTTIDPRDVNSGSCWRSQGPIRHHFTFRDDGLTTRRRLCPRSETIRSPGSKAGKPLARSRESSTILFT